MEQGHISAMEEAQESIKEFSKLSLLSSFSVTQMEASQHTKLNYFSH